MTTFTVDQRVQWPHITQRGSLTEMTTRYGVIVAITGPNATIQPDDHRQTVVIALSSLRPECSTSAVNDFVQEVFQRNRESRGKI